MTAKPGVIYLQKDKFHFFSPFVGRVVEFRFTPEMVRDLDVLNSDLVEQQVKVLVTNGKIQPSNLIVVLSDNAYFVKDFALPNQPVPPTPQAGKPAAIAPKVSLGDLQPQIDLFIEHVPYENVVSKTFPLKNGIRVCAVNQDLYKTIQSAFEKLGFTVDIVIPGMVLGGGLSAKPVLDATLTNMVLQKAPSLKEHDLLSQAAFSPMKKTVEQTDEVQEAMGKEPPKTDKKRLILMVSVFCILLVVLVVVFIQSQQPPTPSVPQPLLTQNPTAASPIATAVVTQPTIQPTETVTRAQTQNLKLQIVSSTTTTTATAAQSLRNGLNAFTFKSVTTQTQNSAGSATTIVSFSSNVNQLVRNVVLQEVRKVKPDIIVQEAQNSANDITIVLGK